MSEDMKKLKKAYTEGMIVPGRNKDGVLTLRRGQGEDFTPIELEEFLISAFEEQNATIDPNTLKFVLARRAELEVPVNSFIEELKTKRRAHTKKMHDKKKNDNEEPDISAAPEPPSINPPDWQPGDGKPPEVPPKPPKKEKKEKPPKETWAPEELMTMPWQDLRKLATTYEECNGLTKKAEIIEALAGLTKN